MIKYASNAFLAVKITFINEIANLCEKAGANVQDVAKAMGRDNRIGAKFLHPGPGYGGSCFPKDTRALAKTGRDYGEPLSLVETAIASNDRQKQRQIAKIEAGLGGAGSLEGKTIAVLGLAFKPNTDDMRESPAITICEGLAAKGARLRIWDPAAMNEALWRFDSIKDSIYRANGEYDAIKDAHALVLLTEWNQFRNLDLGRVKDLLAVPCFFDLRNVYKREEVVHAGLRYFGVGT
jgi:UDPglucose 6-dehydrogenase